MSSTIIDGLLFAWNKNLVYAPKLVADLADEQWVAQPATDLPAPANHPAWVFSHLNVYLPVMQAIIQGEEFKDPKGHPFGMLSKPESSRGTYAAKDELMGEFIAGHNEVARLLKNADDSVFAQPVLLARWSEIMPTAALALPYLMLNHENGHLGQISAWRRFQGLPSV